MSDFIPEDNDTYRDPKYWDGEYRKCPDGFKFEWFSGPITDQIRTKITAQIPSFGSRIIHLGCGVSRLQEVLYDAGYHNIVNVDISPRCIEMMKESDTRGMEWEVRDIMKPLDLGMFDFAIDKGTLDAIIVDWADRWEPAPEAFTVSKQYFENIYNSLNPGGVFIQFTFGQPHFRRRLFQQLDWDVQVYELAPEHNFHLYLYACTRQRPSE